MIFLKLLFLFNVFCLISAKDSFEEDDDPVRYEYRPPVCKTTVDCENVINGSICHKGLCRCKIGYALNELRKIPRCEKIYCQEDFDLCDRTHAHGDVDAWVCDTEINECVCARSTKPDKDYVECVQSYWPAIIAMIVVFGFIFLLCIGGFLCNKLG